MSDRYTVIFEGRIMPGKSADMVRERLKSALDTDDQGVARLFSESPVAVRKNTDLATAEKYKTVFSDAGAFCEIRKESPPTAPTSPPPTSESLPAGENANASSPLASRAHPSVSPVKIHHIPTSDG